MRILRRNEFLTRGCSLARVVISHPLRRLHRIEELLGRRSSLLLAIFQKSSEGGSFWSKELLGRLELVCLFGSSQSGAHLFHIHLRFGLDWLVGWNFFEKRIYFLNLLLRTAYLFFFVELRKYCLFWAKIILFDTLDVVVVTYNFHHTIGALLEHFRVILLFD